MTRLDSRCARPDRKLAETTDRLEHGRPPAGSAVVAVEAGVRVQDALARLPHRDAYGHCRGRALTGTVLADPIVSSLAPRRVNTRMLGMPLRGR